jgi:acetoacetate decarboxylase
MVTRIQFKEGMAFRKEGRRKMLRKVFPFILFSLIVLVSATWPSNTSAADEKAYSMPTMAPSFGPPPYEYRDGWTMAIMFKTTPEVLRDLVPKPLVPNPQNIMVFGNSRYFASGPGQYNEMILSTPVGFEGKPGRYCVYLLLDHDSPIAAGREIWGYPKKLGRIKMEEKDGVIICTVERAGITLVRAAMELNQLVKPEAVSAPIFNLKLIPSVKKDAPPDVMQLTSTTLENRKVYRVYTGKATLEFGTSPADPFHKIPIKEVMGGSYTNQDFTLTYGEVIHDYLKAK